MRKLFTSLLILCSFELWSQKKPVADIQPTWGVDSSDLINLMELLEMGANKYTISQKFKDHYCNVIIDEYKNGQLIGSYNVRDSLRKTTPGLDYVFSVEKGSENGKFELAIYSQKLGDSLLKIYARLGKMGLNHKLKLDKSSGYSWKEVFNQPSGKHPLKTGELYPLLTYTKAVGKEHVKYKGATEFCKISGEIIPYPDWYKELGIEHFFIFFDRLEK